MIEVTCLKVKLCCNRCLPYNLYCVGGDVKPCTIQFVIWEKWSGMLRRNLSDSLCCVSGAGWAVHIADLFSI